MNNLFSSRLKIRDAAKYLLKLISVRQQDAEIKKCLEALEGADLKTTLAMLTHQLNLLLSDDGKPQAKDQ